MMICRRALDSLQRGRVKSCRVCMIYGVNSYKTCLYAQNWMHTHTHVGAHNCLFIFVAALIIIQPMVGNVMSSAHSAAYAQQ